MMDLQFSYSTDSAKSCTTVPLLKSPDSYIEDFMQSLLTPMIRALHSDYDALTESFRSKSLDAQ